MKELVSIITPCYNSEYFISQTINSVISQTYENWEMIIVDDNSTDLSKNIISKFADIDNRLRPIFLDSNQGPALARNIALEKAEGRYVAFLDSDDLWESEKLEKQIKFMKDTNVAFSFTSYTRITEFNNKELTTIIAPKEVCYKSYLSNTIIGCLTVLIDRKKTGYFKMKNLRSSHDMALWLNLMKKGFNAYGLNDNLAKYRVVKGSNTAQKWRAAIDVWYLYREVEKLSFFYSLYCFFGYMFNAISKRI